jgi:biotin synthase-like enzyme
LTLKIVNSIKSKIYISTQVNLKVSKLDKTEIDIYNFKEELFQLLNENKDFQKNMDTLKVAKKNDTRLFL